MAGTKAPSGGGVLSKVEQSRQKTGGRKKGTPNKTTKSLKEAILAAAEAVGQDGNGKGGTQGYLEQLAVTEPKAFAGLLGKVLPMVVAGDADSPLQSITHIKLVPMVPDDAANRAA